MQVLDYVNHTCLIIDLQRDKLQTTSLEPYFDAVAISGELRVAKPDPLIFRFALDQLGLNPSDAWHVGDSLAFDVAGSRAAGLTSVWINRRNVMRSDDAPMPDHELGSLQELFALLDS